MSQTNTRTEMEGKGKGGLGRMMKIELRGPENLNVGGLKIFQNHL